MHLPTHPNAGRESPELTDKLAIRLERWRTRLRHAGLDGLVGAFLGAAAPLSVLGAQVLWIAQPALSAFMPRDEIDALARLLTEPEGVAMLREKLIDDETSATEARAKESEDE